jgi:hypothetical protein
MLIDDEVAQAKYVHFKGFKSLLSSYRVIGIYAEKGADWTRREPLQIIYKMNNYFRFRASVPSLNYDATTTNEATLVRDYIDTYFRCSFNNSACMTCIGQSKLILLPIIST